MIVRNAALYMLGQFSENIQPEISNYAGEILPVLLQYLDGAFATLQPGVKVEVHIFNTVALHKSCSHHTPTHMCASF